MSGADFIDDDLPTNLDYIDSATRPPRVKSIANEEGLRSWQTESDEGEASVNGETIKVLHTEAFDADEDYWETLSVLNDNT